MSANSRKMSAICLRPTIFDRSSQCRSSSAMYGVELSVVSGKRGAFCWGRTILDRAPQCVSWSAWLGGVSSVATNVGRGGRGGGGRGGPGGGRREGWAPQREEPPSEPHSPV